MATLRLQTEQTELIPYLLEQGVIKCVRPTLKKMHKLFITVHPSGRMEIETARKTYTGEEKRQGDLYKGWFDRIPMDVRLQIIAQS